MNMMGFDMGELRLPLASMDPNNAVKLEKELVNAKLIDEIKEGILDK